MATNIQVAVRVRPFLPFEAGAKSCIDVLPGGENDDNSSSSPSMGKSVRIVSSFPYDCSDEMLLNDAINHRIYSPKLYLQYCTSVGITSFT